jgi:hypothetical protein
VLIRLIERKERRSKPRTAHQHRATALIQTILVDPRRAADELERDLRAGGDRDEVFSLLSAAETLAHVRGLDLGAQVALVRGHLREKGSATMAIKDNPNPRDVTIIVRPNLGGGRKQAEATSRDLR